MDPPAFQVEASSSILSDKNVIKVAILLLAAGFWLLADPETSR